MSKKIIAGSLGLALAVSSFSMLGGMTHAAMTGWHEVSVTPAAEIVLGGSVSDEIQLAPTLSTPDSDAADPLLIQSTGAWKLQWQAVTGEEADASTTAAPGTSLGTTGFAATGGYAYAGAQTTATTGNSWGVVLAAGGTNSALSGTPTLGTALSTVATGTATGDATVTPTYSASTTGSLGVDTYYGTIYYVASSNI